MWCKLLAIAALLLVSCSQDVKTRTGDSTHIYTTWTPLELDKCASAWLIKRFVDKSAEFHFIPKGDTVRQGIPYDIPGAMFIRTHNQTTYGSIVQSYNIDDQAVRDIDELIYIIEIDYWREAGNPNAQSVNQDIQNIIKRFKDEQAALQETFDYFDRLYQSFKTRSVSST